ncbi:MAG TPA: hypothetical protein DC053_14705 [Lachnoclostridium sp.]|nr:hypothetical protein [Lachnoclostridium sp.]
MTPPRGGPGLRGTLDGGGPIGTGPPPLGGLPVGGEGGLPVGGEGGLCGLSIGEAGDLSVGGNGGIILLPFRMLIFILYEI